MRIITFFLISMLSFSVFSQNPIFIEPDEDAADSLLRIIKNPPNDTLEMVSCRNLALYYLDLNVDSSKFFSSRALELSRKLKLILWEVDALDLNAIALNRSSDYSRSLEYFLEAINLCSDIKAVNNIWRIEAFTNSDNPINARKSMLATVYLDLGNLYSTTKFHAEALKTFDKSLALAAEINDYTLRNVVNMGIANVYLDLGILDSTELAIRKALLYGDSAKYFQYRGHEYYLLGLIATKQNEVSLAKSYYREGLKWSIEQKNTINEGENYKGLSELLFSEGDLDSSYFYAKKGLLINLKASHKNKTFEAYNQLYKIHKALNQRDSAFFYLEKSKILSDSINAKERLKQFQNIGFREQLRIRELEELEEKANNRLRLNSFIGSTFTLIVIVFLLFRNIKQKQKAKGKIEEAYDQLKATQSQLIQSEKMASLGELTAGIAHEIQNPLNFVNNFSEVNSELIEELEQELEKGNLNEIKAIANDIRENENKIKHHGQRAEGIVKGMLQHSRTNQGVKESTDINTLADEYLRLAYHGMLAKDKSFNTDFKTDFDPDLPKINIIPQDIGRVLLNLINNAFQAVAEVEKSEVIVYTKKLDGKIEIKVSDNGPGIPAEIKDKIFQPFFTTKPTGQGTGLGLSLSYDIVKAYGGEIKIDTSEKKGSEFIIQLPVKM